MLPDGTTTEVPEWMTVDAVEPLAHDTSVLGFDEGVVVGVAEPGLGEGADMELVEELGDPVVDVLRSIGCVEGLEGEREGGDEGLVEGD